MSPRRNRLLLLTALLVAGIASVMAVVHVFAVRFASGDQHADYSTLSTAPRGTRACFEALDALPQLAAYRNLLPLLRFKERAGTTLVFAGADGGFFGEDTPENFEKFEGFLREGLHVVVTANHLSMRDSASGVAPVRDPWTFLDGKALRGGRPRPHKTDDDEEEEKLVTAGERWGFWFEKEGASATEKAEGVPVTMEGRADVPPPPWFSTWRWKIEGEAWQTLASASGKPVVIRRTFDKGSLTLCTDSTFLTNEALWRAPRPAFVVWLLAGQSRLVFDETMHGTSLDPGVIDILGRYRLLGFFAGVAVLLGLFVWKSASTLAPAHPTLAEGVLRGEAGGAGGQSGMADLFSQAVPPAQLLRTCFTEWAKSPFVRRQTPEARVVAVRDLTAAAEAAGRGETVAGYQRIRDFLTRRE